MNTASWEHVETKLAVQMQTVQRPTTVEPLVFAHYATISQIPVKMAIHASLTLLAKRTYVTLPILLHVKEI
jgi:hypothetical protein